MRHRSESGIAVPNWLQHADMLGISEYQTTMQPMSPSVIDRYQRTLQRSEEHNLSVRFGGHGSIFNMITVTGENHCISCPSKWVKKRWDSVDDISSSETYYAI